MPSGMTTLSILTAKILALLYISAGYAAVTGKLSYEKLAADLERSPALTYLAGFMALVFGAVLTGYHNLSVKDWRVLITLVGWLSLVKSCAKKPANWGKLMIGLGIFFGY